MSKYALLAGALMFAAPAFAQTTPSVAQTDPSAAGQADPAATTAPSSATQAAPADPAATTQPASADQVAQIVDKEFPTYDKTGKGSLTKAEFAQWMVALKAQSDPTAKADAKETKAWVNAAFAQADADKDRKVSKAELTGFLSKAHG